MILNKYNIIQCMNKNMLDLHLWDALSVLKNFKNDSVDLIVTSPPYANQRKNTYGGISCDEYVDWFIPIAEELFRVLKPTGTFILNIKENVVKWERHTYVMELVLAMRKMWWLWTEEFIWHKKNSFPWKWPNRFRDSWEHIYQFNKDRKFSMYQDEVKVPIGDWAESRLKNLSEKDKIRDTSRVWSGFWKKIANWTWKTTVYPSNVIHMATECWNKNHSAVFPVHIPEFFIKLFTKKGDLVLDPFMGSWTTNRIAYLLERKSIWIEIMPEYFNQTTENFETLENILNPVDSYEQFNSLRQYTGIHTKQFGDISWGENWQTQKSLEEEKPLFV